MLPVTPVEHHWQLPPPVLAHQLLQQWIHWRELTADTALTGVLLLVEWRTRVLTALGVWTNLVCVAVAELLQAHKQTETHVGVGLVVHERLLVRENDSTTVPDSDGNQLQNFGVDTVAALHGVMVNLIDPATPHQLLKLL